MVRKASLFIIGETGSYLDLQRGTLRALDNNTSLIQVLAPFDTNTVVMVSYLIYGANNETVTQYIPSTAYVGSDVLATTHSLYQTCKDWVLFEKEVTSRAVTKISKHKPGEVGVSFSFKERYAPSQALSYKGTFGLFTALPASSAVIGDYYISDAYDFLSGAITYTKGDYAVWNGTAWTKPTQHLLLANTTTINMTVSPAMTEVSATALTEDAEFELIFADMQGDINNIITGTQVVGEATKATNDADDNSITATYETKADATTHKNRTDNPHTVTKAQIGLGSVDNTADNVKPVSTPQSLALQLKVDKTRTIIGLDLQNDIDITAFRTALGVVTTSVVGLMSATDKTRLDTLYALLANDDADTVVDTVAEVLAIFQSYPEGADLVSALAGKVDKVTGKSLIADTEIAKLLALYTKAQLDALLDAKLTKDISTLTALVASSASGNEELYVFDNGYYRKMTLTEIYTGANTATGSFVPTGDYSPDGMGAYKSSIITAHTLTAVTNGDFKVSIRTQGVGLLYVIFPATTATQTLRVSTDNGTTYYNVLKNGATMRASTVSGQLVRLQFDGTNFIADIQGSTVISESYSNKLNSTYGLFAPENNGIPMIKEISGRTIPALANLLTAGGDFASGWTITDATGTVAGGVYPFTASAQNGGISQAFTQVSGNIYYIVARVKANSTNVKMQVNGEATSIVAHAGGNVYQLLIARYTASSSGSVTFQVIDTNTSGWAQVDVDYAMVHNLTAKFGASLEPTTAVMNAIVEALGTNGYISTTSTTHVTNSQFKTRGTQLFNVAEWVASYAYKIPVKASTAYTWSTSIAYKLYDAYSNEIASATASTVTTTASTRYIAFNAITTPSTFMLNEGSTLLTWVAYNSETQLFNHGALRSTIGGATKDKIRYLNGQYVLDKYVGYDTTVVKASTGWVASAELTNTIRFRLDLKSSLDYVGNTVTTSLNKLHLTIDDDIYANNTSANLLTTDVEGVAVDSQNLLTIRILKSRLASVDASGFETFLQANTVEFIYELATPLLAQSVIDVDGTLIQETTTTTEQLQTLPTTVNIEFSMNTDQTAKTLVQRDKVQQETIDANEASIVTLTARKTTTNDIIIMSATAWSTYTQVTGEVYGVYNESTFVITFYYGQTA